MRIVVLDGHPLNAGDLNWGPLGKLGDCTIFDRTPPDQILERSTGAEIILSNKTVLDRKVLSSLDSLRYIGVLATGYNNVDIAVASERGILVTNVPSYATESVAQMVFAHMLNLASGIAHHARAVQEGRWGSSGDWSYRETNLVEIAGTTLGIVGFGRIGRAVARLARGFGMTVIAHDPAPDTSAEAEGVAFVDLDELFRRSDVVTLHCPLTDYTRGLVGRERIALMKRTAILINTSRGPLVDEAALAEALVQERIAGAGFDVLTEEPPTSDSPLLHAPHCFITPHIAWATYAARKRLLDIAIDNVRAFMEGKPNNVVSHR